MIRILELLPLDPIAGRRIRVRVTLELDGTTSAHEQVVHRETSASIPDFERLARSREAYLDLLPYIEEKPGHGSVENHPIFRRLTRAVFDRVQGKDLALPIELWKGKRVSK